MNASSPIAGCQRSNLYAGGSTVNRLDSRRQVERQMRAKMSGATKLECLSLSTEPHTQKKVKRVLRVVPLHLIWRSENSFKGGSAGFSRSSGSKVAPSSSGSRRVLESTSNVWPQKFGSALSLSTVSHIKK